VSNAAHLSFSIIACAPARRRRPNNVPCLLLQFNVIRVMVQQMRATAETIPDEQAMKDLAADVATLK
jgi:hypothetical protein